MTRRDIIKSGAGLAAIIAAGKAPAALVRSMVAARQSIAAAAASGWKNPYITDGLIAMWDGEWNAGGGIHDASATGWKDLIGGYGDMQIVNGLWDVDNVYGSGGRVLAKIAGKTMTDHVVEIVFETTGACVFHFGSRRGIAIKSTTSLVYSFQRAVGVSGGRMAAYLYYPQSGDIREKANPIYVNGSLVTDYYNRDDVGMNTDAFMRVGGAVVGDEFKSLKVYAIRLYTGITESRVSANYAVDAARFNLPDAT